MITTRVFVVTGFCAIFAMSACDQDAVLEPRAVTPQSPRFSEGPPSASGTLGITSSIDPSASVDLMTYPEPIFVEIRLSGAITQVSNGGYYSGYTGPIYGPGIRVDGVYQACYVDVLIYHDYGPYAFGQCIRTPNTDTLHADGLHVDSALFKGAVSIRRGVAVPLNSYERDGACGGPCYVYSGSQDYRITPISAALELAASKTVLVAEENVTFTAGSSPGYIRGTKVPIRVLRWQWVPATGNGQTVACAAGVNPCTTRVRESGTMTVTAVVNGVEQTKSIAIELTCPTEDEFLDDPDVRDSLKVLWNLSNAEAPASERKEQAGWLYRNPATGDVFFKPWPNPGNSPCESTTPAVDPNNPPQTWIIAHAHTHPFKNREPLPDHPDCKADPSSVSAYDAVRWGGPSRHDWREVQKDRAPVDGFGPWRKVPEYVLDKDNIYRADTTVTKPGRTSAKKWARQVGSCTRI